MKNLPTLIYRLVVVLIISAPWHVNAQEDSTYVEEEEDFSMYDDLEFVDGDAKRFASAKIKGISPAKLISIGYDYQASHQITAGAYESFSEQTARINAVHGYRVGFNVPVISRNNIIVQLGAQYWDMTYDFMNPGSLNHPLLKTLSSHGLRTTGVNTTIFKPLNEKSFILVQAAADMNGDFAVPEFQNMRYNRYSVAALWGKRPSDYTQWAIGVSRTYRAGELNYVPVILYNWTSVSNTWGAEVLFPARAHMRYTINPRNMLFAGFELEGNSYRIGNRDQTLSDTASNAAVTVIQNREYEYEIRRGELRFRMVYERKLIGFIWLSAQAGYRVNYSYNVDEVPNGTDFYRGFFGTQPLAMQNSMTNPFYANISINLVSP